MKRNLLFICLLFLFNCKKESGGEGDGQAPIIIITAPTNNQVFSAGQSVTITANISDNQKIKETHLEIINTTTGAFLTHEHYVPDGASFVINKTFTAQGSSAYKIKIEAEDLNGNKAKTEINIASN